jgi:hypothetical protein
MRSVLHPPNINIYILPSLKYIQTLPDYIIRISFHGRFLPESLMNYSIGNYNRRNPGGILKTIGDKTN